MFPAWSRLIWMNPSHPLGSLHSRERCLKLGKASSQRERGRNCNLLLKGRGSVFHVLPVTAPSEDDHSGAILRRILVRQRAMSSLGSRKESRPPVMVPPMALQRKQTSNKGGLAQKKSLRQELSVPWLSLVTQWCPTLCELLDWSPPGSAFHGISQGRILEWVSIPLPELGNKSRSFTLPEVWNWRMWHCPL